MTEEMDNEFLLDEEVEQLKATELLRRELDTINTDLHNLQDVKKEIDSKAKVLEAKIKTLKNRALEISEQIELTPVTEISVRYTGTSGRSIRITRPETPSYIDPVTFLSKVGPEIFLEVVEILQIDIIPDKWEKVLREERASRSDLLESLKDGEARKPTVVVE